MNGSILARCVFGAMASVALSLSAAASDEGAACVQWALDDVKAELQRAGVPWGEARIAVEPLPGKDLSAEGFRLAVEKGEVNVSGGDAVGVMYGLLELAEQIRNGGATGEWSKVAATLSGATQKPFLEFRASNPFIHTVPHLLLDDVEMWRRYIDVLARNRFNVLDLHGGYDLNNTQFPNLYPFLVQVREYPAVGKPEQQAKNLKNFRAIAAHAHARGLKVAFMNYEAGSSGAPAGKNLADYTAKAVATLLREVPDLDMLGFRVGESGQPAQFFKDAYLQGLADSGRKDIRLYTRSWLTTQAALESIGRASDGRFDIEVKYNGEQLGLPYQAIHGIHDAGGSKAASYSYEGYICNDAPYRIVWQVRANGTHRYWAWEDTEFVRRCVGTFTLGQARGLTLEPSIAYFPVSAAAYYARAEDKQVYDFIWEKHGMSFFAWGRLSYDPQLPAATIVAEFQRRFGPAGKDIYQAMQAGGKIVPLVLSYRYLGPDHRNHSPETETGYTPDAAKKGGPGALEFAGNSPMDSRSFVGINAFVANKIAGKTDGRIGPEHVATLLAAAAAETRKIVEGVTIPPGRPADEWRLLKTDLLAAAALGEYYAARIRGTMHLVYAIQAGCEADYQLALKLLAESRAAWKALAETTDPVYAPLNNPLRGQMKFRWGQALKSLETMDAAIASDFPRKADAAPLTFTATEKGQDSGIVIGDVRHAIDPAGAVQIACKASGKAPVKAMLLWHKKLPSTEKWQCTTMSGQDEFSATVPLTAVGLMYQIEAQGESGQAAIFPPVLKTTPYQVIAPSDLRGLNSPAAKPAVKSTKNERPAGQNKEETAVTTRSMRYSSRPADQTLAWQKEVRDKLFRALKLDDLVSRKVPVPLDAKVLSSQKKEKYTLQEIEISSTQGRRMKALLALPTAGTGPFPAVVCIHGHGATRQTVYDPQSIYKGFAAALAERGYVTIATDVGQHEVYEKDRILAGERLWDLMRCVDYLESLPESDKSRIGCAGLSLGGEMAMWLGAMDTRVRATVSAGFLGRMDTMERDHCMCWKFPGLRELVDFADIFSLMAPRPLLCQNGKQEPPSQFPPAIAQEVLTEIRVAYADLGKPENARLVVHEEGHVVDVPSLLEFFATQLGPAVPVANPGKTGP